MDVYAGQNQIFQGVERDLDYDDGGEDYHWSSTCVMVPEGEDPKMWLQERMKVLVRCCTPSTTLLKTKNITILCDLLSPELQNQKVICH